MSRVQGLGLREYDNTIMERLQNKGTIKGSIKNL